MSLSKYFKSMDEVRSYVENFQKTSTLEEYKILLQIFGLGEQEGEFEIVSVGGDEKMVDRFLVPIIKDLNHRGYRTIACCSGLQREHTAKRNYGYLSLAFEDRLIEALEAAINSQDVKIRELECYLQRSVHIEVVYRTDLDLEKQWMVLWDVLKNIKAI